MRILNVTQTYAPFFEFGGPPVKVGALARGMAARGHEVTVLTADWGLQRKLTAMPQEFSVDHSPFGLRITEGNSRAIYLPTWLRYRSLSWNPAIQRYCRARLRDFDVAHIFGLYDFLGPAVAAACRGGKIPYVVEPIGMFVPIVRNIWLKRLYHSIWGKKLLRGAAAIIATAEQETAELVAGGIPEEKIVLRRNGIEPPAALPRRGVFRAARQIPADANLVLFLGRLSTKKSPELLLKAFASLPAQIDGRTTRLVFAGPDEGDMRSQLEAMAAQLGIRERVTFSGAIFDDEKWSAYADADVFVLPSRNENFGNTAAEAAILGIPVILTENCGVAPLLAETSAIVIPHSEAALANSLETLLRDTTLRARLSGGAGEARQRLGWAEPLARMELLYSKLAPAPPPGAKSVARE